MVEWWNNPQADGKFRVFESFDSHLLRKFEVQLGFKL
jgi:hypothetical protein